MFLRNQASIAYLFRWCHIYCINMNNPGSLSHLRVRKVPWIRGGSQTHNLRFKNPEDLLRQNNLTSKNTCCIIGTIAPILILPHFISVVKQISTLLLLPLKGEADEGENYYMLGPRVGDPYSRKHKERPESMFVKGRRVEGSSRVGPGRRWKVSDGNSRLRKISWWPTPWSHVSKVMSCMVMSPRGNASESHVPAIHVQ